MKIKNLDFRNINSVLFLLRRDFQDERLIYPGLEETINLFRKAAPQEVGGERAENGLVRRGTVHFYQLRDRQYSKRLIEEGDRQFYFAVDEEQEKVAVALGGWSGSSLRANHNKLLEYFLDEPELRDTPTTILVMHRDLVLAHYIHPSYGFMNQSIGTNHDGMFHKITHDRDELRWLAEHSGIPHSRFEIFRSDASYRVTFGNDVLRHTIYQSAAKNYRR